MPVEWEVAGSNPSVVLFFSPFLFFLFLSFPLAAFSFFSLLSIFPFKLAPPLQCLSIFSSCGIISLCMVLACACRVGF